MTAKETVYVAMSGGVDSSVSAARLQEENYNVVGVFIRVWHPDWLPCDWKKEREDAMRVCAVLNIPFKTLDLSKEYKKEVVDYMLKEYESGRTPNPDVMCNKHIKFAAFLNFAVTEGADHVATGHYARIRKKGDMYELLAGKDAKKDQSYFLWTLDQQVLSKTLFPIGEHAKEEVRDMAAVYHLPVAEKKDSQGVCFLGKINMREFLQHYIKATPGDVLARDGKVIGKHEGAVLYTIGQRHGFEIYADIPNMSPHYVISKNMAKNTITVSSERNLSTDIQQDNVVRLDGVHWIDPEPQEEYVCTARVRYRQPLQLCYVSEYDRDAGTAVVSFPKSKQDVALGQSVVLYDNEVCLGGGIVSAAS